MANRETLTRYSFDAISVIQRIDVRTQEDGRAVAYLYAKEDPALQPQRQNIRAAIRLKGWGTLSDHHESQFSLRVSGLHGTSELVTMLQNEGLLGAPTEQISHEVESAPTPSTWWGKIRANSLKYSGILATIGNAMSFASGVHRGNEWGQMGQGLAFGLADLPLAIAGGRDDARQLGDFLRRLKTHYEREGIEIPHTASIHVETSDHGKGFGERAMDYLHRYANQIKCGMEGVAAVSTIYAGKNQGNAWKKYTPFVWGSGFLASLLIPERKIDPERYASAGLLGRAWMNIQSNPLSVGGVLGWSNNIASVMGGRAERAKSLAPGGDGRKLYRWDFAIPSVMVSANGLYAMSKKTVGGDIKSSAMVDDAYTIAAQIINKQPENLREKAIESTAKFFGERTEIPETHTEVIARLRREVSIQRQNPWFEPQGLPTYTPQRKAGRLRMGGASHAAVNDNEIAANGYEKPESSVSVASIEHQRKAEAHGVTATANHLG